MSRVPRSTGEDLPSEVVSAFQSKIKSQVLIKGQAPEEEYRAILERWCRVHIKEAQIVVLPENEEDVTNTINFVREHHLDVAISGGRHTWSGPSSGYGVVIDMRRMRKVTVLPGEKIALAQGGCVAGDVEKAAAEHNLRPVMGAVNATGCGGITTGGGIGQLTAQHGLVCDNLVSARVALADGRILTASETENPDLFFGIRGGGSNFGIVTEFSYKLHDCDHLVYSGIMMYIPDKLEAAIKLMNSLHLDYVLKSNGKFAVVGFFGVQGVDVCPGFIVFYDGPEEEALPFVKPLQDLGPVQAMLGMQPYTSVTEWENISKMFPPGFERVTGSSTQVDYPVPEEIWWGAVNGFKEIIKIAPERLYASKIIIDIRDYNKVASVPVDATAYANRRAACIIAAEIFWDKPDLDVQMREVTKTQIDGLRAKVKEMGALKDDGGHMAATTLYSLLTDGQEKLKMIFGPNLPKLRDIKLKYDPNVMWDKWYTIPPAEVPN